MPNRKTLDRARVKFDAAVEMHFRKHNHAHQGKVWRWLTYDASPQGREVFAAMEFVTHDQNQQTSHQNKLPLVSLGQGHFAMVDKHMCLHHFIFLRAGPSQSGMVHYMRSVRGCISDLGQEVGLADAPNFMDAYLRGSACADDAAKAKGTFLFPYALTLPGPSHMLDWILKRVTSRFMHLQYRGNSCEYRS